MYICDGCHKSTKPNEKMRKVVTQSRERTYPQGFDQASFGSEIVEEKKLCYYCATGTTRPAEPLPVQAEPGAMV